MRLRKSNISTNAWPKPSKRSRSFKDRGHAGQTCIIARALDHAELFSVVTDDELARIEKASGAVAE